MKLVMIKAVFFSLLLLAVVCAPAGGVPKRQLRKRFLRQHNIARREETNATNMCKMKWDRNLAKSAQQYADQCDFAHSTNTYRREVSGRTQWSWIGENIYITTQMNPDDIVNMATNSWKEEKAYYDFNTRTCQQGKVCGHYTQVSVCECVCTCVYVFMCLPYEHVHRLYPFQMIWASTFRLGCCARYCSSIKNNPFQNSNSGTIVICHYGPGCVGRVTCLHACVHVCV